MFHRSQAELGVVGEEAKGLDDFNVQDGPSPNRGHALDGAKDREEVLLENIVDCGRVDHRLQVVQEDLRKSTRQLM